MVIVEAFRVVVLPTEVVSMTVTIEVTARMVLVDSLVAMEVMVFVTVAALSEVVLVVTSVM